MKLFDESGRQRFTNGTIVFCKPDSLESKEWAPFQHTTACKAGEELKVIKLGADGGCPDDVFSFFASVEGDCVALIQDWAGATYMTIAKG